MTLAPHDAAGLANYIAALSNTASPDYRHFLTTTQFAQHYGASASAVDAVRDYFQGYGLRVGDLSRVASSCT